MNGALVALLSPDIVSELTGKGAARGTRQRVHCQGVREMH